MLLSYFPALNLTDISPRLPSCSLTAPNLLNSYPPLNKEHRNSRQDDKIFYLFSSAFLSCRTHCLSNTSRNADISSSDKHVTSKSLSDEIVLESSSGILPPLSSCSCLTYVIWGGHVSNRALFTIASWVTCSEFALPRFGISLKTLCHFYIQS